jgi:flagellin
MRINTNIASMNAQTNAANTNKTLTSSLEKLSSGLRINKAADDASGMAIADKLRTQASALGQGISNANSANALIQIADKALGEQSSILDTVKTKLIQASTSTTSEEGREAIRKDITKLLAQLDDISEQTNYNGINLLNEKGAQFTFQVGEKASTDISVSTAYAVNTSGLGATNEIPVDAEAQLRYSTAAGAVGIQTAGTTLTVTNNSTVSTGTKAIMINDIAVRSATAGGAVGDSAFMMTAKSVEALVIRGSVGSSVTIETSDQDTIDLFNSLASASSADGLTRNSDGNYTFKTLATSFATISFGGSKVDLTDLKFTDVDVGSSQSTSDTIFVATSDEVTITKLSGANPIQLDSAMLNFSVTTGAYSSGGVAATAATGTLQGMGSTNADGIIYGGVKAAAGEGVYIETGTASVKVADENLDKATIGINTMIDSQALATADASFTINADQVSYLTMKAAAVVGSVVMTTSDADTAKSLAEVAKTNKNLTQIDDSTFTFTATAAAADATIDFGSEKVDLTNLTISGATNGVEQIYLRTHETVTVTKNGSEDDVDVSLAAFNDTTASSLAQMVGVITDAASDIGSLAALKSLKEGELTAELANEYMANIDEALNQLNSVRADFGSTQNQLDVATRNMMVTQVNIKAAESVIRDVDYAAESANFNKQNIIAQAGTYAMSQANAMQQNVMRLLQ